MRHGTRTAAAAIFAAPLLFGASPVAADGAGFDHGSTSRSIDQPGDAEADVTLSAAKLRVSSSVVSSLPPHLPEPLGNEYRASRADARGTIEVSQGLVPGATYQVTIRFLIPSTGADALSVSSQDGPLALLSEPQRTDAWAAVYASIESTAWRGGMLTRVNLACTGYMPYFWPCSNPGENAVVHQVTVSQSGTPTITLDIAITAYSTISSRGESASARGTLQLTGVDIVQVPSN